MIRGSAQCSGSYKKIDIRIRDEKPDYGEEAGEEMILLKEQLFSKRTFLAQVLSLERLISVF